MLKTYPPGVKLGSTEAAIVKVEPDGRRWIDGSVDQIQCYGTKITLKLAVNLDGKTYPPGTKLTVDRDLSWVEVSSWD